MATATETYVLAEMRTITAPDGSKAETIRTIVRTYLSNRRAEQDLELMNQLQPDVAYRVFTVEHIDD
jgi:hypothetical protein